jgi:heme ABC exporter ATP-binding subunit CcmA
MALAVLLRNAVALNGPFPALAGADLSVDSGEVVVLQGANGAGKTSLLRVCAGLLPVISGHAVVLGCDLRRGRGAVRRRVGLLGHAVLLYDDLTAEENVRFAVRAARRDPGRVHPALERLELIGRVGRTAVGRLSAGQRRRVALAVLVARDPELWLLDEPHAALDAEGRVLVGALVAEAAGRGGTVLIASHEPDATLPLADRVVTVAGGRVAGIETLRPAPAPRPPRGAVPDLTPRPDPTPVPGLIESDTAATPTVPTDRAASVPGGVHVA